MTYILDLTPAEAVANGAQLLDEKLPGWWREITLDTLNLSDCRNCVCGQLANTAAVTAILAEAHGQDFVVNSVPLSVYAETLTMLNLSWRMHGEEDWEQDYNYGFNVKPYDDYADSITYDEWDKLSAETFKALDVEWRRVIESRLEADRLPARAVERETVPA